MPTNTPYSRMTGTWTIYVAAYGTASSDLDVAMAGAWTELGPTDGTQSIKMTGSAEYFYDNDNLGPVKAVNPVAGVTVTATLVNMTPEQLAVAIGMAAADVIAHDTVPGAVSVELLPLGQDFAANEFALTMRGGAQPITNVMSPFGAWPAQFYIPRGVFDGEPELVFSKDGSPGAEFTFTALVDPNAPAAQELGVFESRDV